MSIWGKPASAVSANDLVELLQDEAVENVRLEFKLEAPGRDEMLKKLSSFANTFGGYLVVGAEAKSSDGKLVGLPGVEVQPSYKQTITQWCFGFASPPLNAEVSGPLKVLTSDDKVCYVISVAESDLAPHFLNGRKGVYVRTDEFSGRFEARLATENELRHLLARRELIRERRAALIARARERFDSYVSLHYLEFNRAEAAKGPKEFERSIGARFDLAIVPRFPSEPISNHEQLIEIVRSKRIAWRDVGFPRAEEIVSQHESVLALKSGSGFSFLEVNIWGMTFYAAELYDQNSKLEGIHLDKFLGNLLAYLTYSAQILRDLNYNGPFRVEMRMRGMRGVPWVSFFNRYQSAESSSVLDDTIFFGLHVSTDSFKPEDLALKILRQVFLATNSATFAYTNKKANPLLKAAYDFNGWGTPPDDEPGNTFSQ